MKISCCTQARPHPLLNPVKAVLCAEMMHNKQLHCLSTLLHETFFSGFIFSPFNKALPVLVGTSPCPQSGSDTSPGLVEPSGRISNQLHFPETGATSSIYRCCSGGEKKKYNPSSVCYNESQKAHDAPQKPEPKKQCGRTLVPSLENTA